MNQVESVMNGWKRKASQMAMATGLVAMMGATVLAQAPAGGPDGAPWMGPHRPPMERALGPGGPHGDHGRWWNDPAAITKFKLTDTQRKAMDDIYQQHKVTLVDLHATLEKQELGLEPLMKADQPDEGQILAQIDRVAQARAELEKANARMLLGLRKQLTPEQWKQMEADRAARRAQGEGGGHGQFRRGGPGGPGASGAPGNGPGGPGGPMAPDVEGPGAE